MEREMAAGRVRLFAESVCREQSPLYERLCAGIAEDAPLLEIARAVPDGQPVPNLFLGAVHFLLLSGARHELAGYYPTCGASPRPAAGAFPAFREFCLEREVEIRALMAARRVQTNEVRRCAYLYPAFSTVSRLLEGRPLALFEVGCSGGFLLNWDRCAYDYGDGRIHGDPRARVRIRSEWRGAGRAPLAEPFPAVRERTGFDLRAVDVRDPVEARWLRSLLWPDQPERHALMEAAVAQFRESPAPLVEGDALDLLPGALAAAPESAGLCVFHSHTLNQFSEAQRARFRALLAGAAPGRPLCQVSAEWLYTDFTQLRILRWEDGSEREELAARVDHHGRWIEWPSA